MKLLCLAAACLLHAALVRGDAIDNGVEGDPEIECGPTSITVNFNTQNTFEGHVYVKGRFNEQDCRTSNGGRRVASIELDFSACGVKRERSANPKGVFVTTTVVISFHPQFLTKIDRAYKLQCFYMEADKTVSTELEVSMLTTVFQTETVPMPICRYEILEGGPSGPIIQFALIGQQVYHKWICDTETVGTFCMVVHSCFVDDGAGDRVDLVGADGCGLDGNLLGNLEYADPNGMLMAGVQAHVFKYADRPNLFFNCQITITVKDPNVDCPVPSCPAPNRTLGKRRRRRSLQSESNVAAVIDVSPQDLEVLDLDTDEPVNSLLPRPRFPAREQRLLAAAEGAICLSPATFGIALAGAVAVLASLFAFAFYSFSSGGHKQ